MLLALSFGLATRGASGSTAASAKPKATVLTAAGSKVQRRVEKFRNLLGPDNGGAPSGKSMLALKRAASEIRKPVDAGEI